MPTDPSRSSSDSQQAIVGTLLAVQRATVRELAAATGLPRSTVAHAVSGLLSAGLLHEHAAQRRSRGRPSRAYSLSSQPRPIAVLVAAAHGTLAGVVTADGTVLSQVEGPPLEGDADGRLGAAGLDLLDRALELADVAAGDLSFAIVGLPGPSLFGAEARPDDVISAQAQHLHAYQSWDGEPAAQRVGRHLGCAAFAENDANLAAVAEAINGAGTGMPLIMFISLAYGTSAGLVIGGRLHRGRSRLAGEIGHLHSVDDGQLCQCGARGCFWLTSSIPALLQELSAVHHRPFTLEAVSVAAQRDQADVVRALVGFGHALGRRLADAVIFLDPDAIVLDGALGAAADPIAQGIRESIAQYAPPAMASVPRVVVGRLGSSAMLVGASALARSEGLLVETFSGQDGPAHGRPARRQTSRGGRVG